MASLQARVRLHIDQTKTSITRKRHVDGWMLPKQSTSFAPEGTWTNVDLDVTPLDRRIWTPLSFLGYWISDIVSKHCSRSQNIHEADAHITTAQRSVLADWCLCPCYRSYLSGSNMVRDPGVHSHGCGHRF
jgi:hypothetical protein